MITNQIELIQELGTNFIEYAAAVNTDRAIPDATEFSSGRLQIVTYQDGGLGIFVE